MVEVCHRILFKIAKEINASLDSEQVFNAIVQSITVSLEAKGAILMLLSQNRKKLLNKASFGLSDTYIKKIPVTIDAITREVLLGKSVWIEDISADKRVSYREDAKKEGITSALLVPFKLKRKTVGVLRLYLSKPRSFSEDAIEFLDAAANLGAIALEKARIYESQEKNLQKITEQLKKLAEERERFMHFFNIAAHDLKAPLEAIQSYLWVILGGYAGNINPKHRTMIERSSKRVDGLLLLISDLLDVSRVEVGKVFDELEDTPLDKVVENCLEMAGDLARIKNIELIINVPDNLPIIQSSPLRLQQLISNLISNAIKYSEKGGKVTFQMQVTDNEIKVEVIDEGIGIPKEDLPYLFTEFFRARNVGKQEGTGLGLNIVKRIIEAHKGHIWVESPCVETGKGSKFAFILPRNIKYAKSTKE